MNEEKKLPEKENNVWIELEGKRSNWVVKSKKDTSKGGGCFNCKGLENGEKKSINFNLVKWGFLEINKGGAVKLQLGASGSGQNKTPPPLPPPLPPRVPTPPGTLPPPPPPPTSSRIKKHF